MHFRHWLLLVATASLALLNSANAQFADARDPPPAG